METFGFTRKKFLSVCEKNQHRHLIKWLSKIYHQMTTNRSGLSSPDDWYRQYNMILGWMDLPQFTLQQFTPPAQASQRLILEALSDRIHFHRSLSGENVRDTKLLGKVQFSDQSIPPEPLNNMDCHIALDGLRSLFNVGSVFRICEASGFRSVILHNTLGKDHKTVQKTAMGSQQWVDEETSEDLYDTLIKKKSRGYRIYGIETVSGATPYDQAVWQPRSILVLGNEEYGISSHVLAACDEFVYLPMAGRKNSINVAAAAGVVCFSVYRSLARAELTDTRPDTPEKTMTEK